MTTNNVVNSPLSGTTGTGNFVGSTSPTITTPKIITGINDANGNEILGFQPAASSVNFLTIVNGSTTQAPTLLTTGSDTNVLLQLTGKGTSGVGTQGTTTNGNAITGNVGQLISSVIASASAVSLSNVTPKDITSISLTAGDWDIYGNVLAQGSIGNLISFYSWCSLATATWPDASLYNGVNSTALLASIYAANTPYLRVSISSTTTVFLSARAGFSSGTVTGCGGIYARRIR